MWSGLIEVQDIGVEHPLKLLLMQDEQVIETLAPHTPQKALADGIRSRGVIRCCEYLDATRLGNPREAHPKRAIVITDEILRPYTIGGGFSQLLCGPRVAGRSWKSVDADEDHCARVQFDDDEGKVHTMLVKRVMKARIPCTVSVTPCEDKQLKAFRLYASSGESASRERPGKVLSKA
jgi:hypothetical protein